MTPDDPLSDDGPELVPPAELLRLRDVLVSEASPAVRAQHLAATTSAARHRSRRPMGRFATRGARAALAVVASLAITTGLAGAQLLPQSAQRIFSNVSDRFAPDESRPDDAPPATAAEAGDDTATRPGPDGRPTDTGDPGAADATTLATEPGTDSEVTTPTTSRPPAPTTTIPGPTGPGSPVDPTDPSATTTTTAPEPTTTTTTPGPTTTTTTPGTTTTTRPPSP